MDNRTTLRATVRNNRIPRILQLLGYSITQPAGEYPGLKEFLMLTGLERENKVTWTRIELDLVTEKVKGSDKNLGTLVSILKELSPTADAPDESLTMRIFLSIGSLHKLLCLMEKLEWNVHWVVYPKYKYCGEASGVDVIITLNLQHLPDDLTVPLDLFHILGL